MTRKEHVCFCRVCNHSKFSKEKGLICGLTNDLADFDMDCPNFAGDRNEIVLPVRKPDNSIESLLSGKPEEKKENPVFVFLKQYFVTSFLSGILLFTFLLMVFSGVHIFDPDIQDMVSWGANSKLLTLGGQYWRLLTSMIIHFGIIHLAFNIYALVFAGIFLEQLIGHYRLFLSFLITGIMSGIVSALWHDSNMVSAGASGAIFGLFGVYMAILTTGLVDKKRRAGMLTSMVIFVAYNLLGGIRNDVDNAAHIAGLFGGVILGYSFYPSLKHKDSIFHEYIVGTVPFILLIIISGFVVTHFPTNLRALDKLYADFSRHEMEALKFYTMLNDDISPGDFVDFINETAIPEWEKCREISGEMKKIEGLTDEHYYIMDLYERYCDYRIEVYTFTGKSLAEQTYMYGGRIRYYNDIINRIIQRINGEDIEDKLLVADPQILKSEEKFRPLVNRATQEYLSNHKDVNLLKDFVAYEKHSYKYGRQPRTDTKSNESADLRYYDENLINARLENQDLTLEEKFKSLEDILFVVDGQPVESLEHVDEQQIQSMTYFKPETAEAFYGNKGKNGAVVITTK
ncbi:rhomboid family intramembrane serine protease [Saccharicrinis sp. FJH54]|uniref:rhomboid family intramembrane serine protease n=1 Tax=Saccharicrinis sp. FJH54 TaxID=3344665 RepID=UPI0035D4B2A9